MEFKEAAYHILKQTKKPLSYKEITEIALRENLISTEGKTPEASMRSRLYLDIQHSGDESKFVKVEKGIFALREWYREDIKSFAEAKEDRRPSESLIDILKETHFKSESPNEFEEAIKDAFIYLGFEGELIGGSGDTDVLLTANIGTKAFKVSVDGKTSKSGKVIDRQIDWLSLEDHREKNKAKYIVVVGPDFAGGNLMSRAKQYNVSLLTTDGLIKLIRAHSQFPFTLTELKDLFAGKGDLSPQLEDLLSQNLSRRNLLEHFRVIIEEMQALQDRLGYFTFDSLAGRERLEELEIEPKDIDYIIELLMLPFVNGVQEISAGRYILAIRIKDIANIFNQISELLAGAEDKEEIIEIMPAAEKVEKAEEVEPERKLGSKYFRWYKSGHSIVAEARKENPYKHHCPIEHFKTILEMIVNAFDHQNIVSVDVIFSKLEGRELAPNRSFKGKAEDYKIRMTLGILEIEELIKWTGAKRPIEYKLNVPLGEINVWLRQNRM
jgi:DNA-directed RNA polymerase delta subunit